MGSWKPGGNIIKFNTKTHILFYILSTISPLPTRPHWKDTSAFFLHHQPSCLLERPWRGAGALHVDESPLHWPDLNCINSFLHKLLYESEHFFIHKFTLSYTVTTGHLMSPQLSAHCVPRWEFHHSDRFAARSWAETSEKLCISGSSSGTFQRGLSQTTGKNVCLKLMVLSSHLRPNRTNKKHLCQTASFIT